MEITTEWFTAAIEAAVSERGADFVYPSGEEGWVVPDGEGSGCAYVRTDVEEPACLFGVALHKSGVSLEHLREVEGLDVASILQGLQPQSPHKLLMAVSRAQQSQDEGHSWGYALRIYKDELGR